MRGWGSALVVMVVTELLIVLPAACNSSNSSSGSKSSKTAAGTPIPLPNTFPNDFPIYPGAKYQGRDHEVGQVGSRNYDRGWFETHDDGQKVIDWYTAHLPEAGYPPVASVHVPGDTRFGFAADKAAVQMEIFPEQNMPTSFSVDFFAPPVSTPVPTP